MSRAWVQDAQGYPFALILGDVLFDRGALMARSPTIADLAGEPWALIHPDDAAALGAKDGDSVVLSSRRGSVAVRARISASIRPGEIYLPRGYDAAPANRLVDAREPLTSVQVRVLVPATT
jgi:anaerobic selenocysteine-containing dehydrogenase